MEYSLKEIIDLLKKRFVLIVVCIFAGLFTFFLISSFIIKPTYVASVQMYVIPNNSTDSVDLNELGYAQKVVITYINFLQTKVFYKQVIEKSNLDYTYEKLKDMTNIQSVNNTEVFQISVASHDPYDSFYLVEAMQDIAPGLIKSINKRAEINVVDPVVLPTKPSSPNKVINTIVGGMLGFILSVLASFLWELIYVNVKDQDDLFKRYQLPILGAIPNSAVYKKPNYLLNKMVHTLDKRKRFTKIESSKYKDTKFIISEAYKELRTNLRFKLQGKECKKVIISSPSPGDGLRNTSANIGITFARTGAMVLLIDCDLRKGRLHSLFNLESSPGISDALSGMINMAAVIRATSYENLHVITMGSVPPHSTELLGSVQMEDLLKKLEKNYDYIIIDTPPVNVVSDSLSLVKMADGVIIEVRESVTSHLNITNSITKYKFAEANILGFVINDVSLNQSKKSKYQYYY